MLLMPRLLYILTAWTIAAIPAFAQRTILVPFQQAHRWGYCDTNGQVVIAPQYDEAAFFTGQCAVVSVHNKQGLIDHTGQWILPAVYALISFEQRANADGTYAVTTRTDAVAKSGVFSPKRGWLFKVEYDQVYYNSCGFWIASNQKPGSSEGEMVDYILKQGRVKRYHGHCHEPECGCAKHQQAFYDMMNRYSQCRFVYQNGKTGFHCEVPRRHKKLGVWRSLAYDMPAVYDSLFQLPEPTGRAPFRLDRFIALSNGKYGIVDTRNKVLLPLEYDAIWPQGRGHVPYQHLAVKKNARWGLVSEQYSTRIPCTYDSLNVYNANKGWYQAWKDGQCGMVDTLNRIVLPIRFFRLEHDYYATTQFRVSDSSKRLGLFDVTQSKWEIRPEYENIKELIEYENRILCYRYYLLQKAGKQQLYDPAIHDTISEAYNSIEIIKHPCREIAATVFSILVKDQNQYAIIPVKPGKKASIKFYQHIANYSEYMPTSGDDGMSLYLVERNGGNGDYGYINEVGKEMFPVK